jgi:hypothetical protein
MERRFYFHDVLKAFTDRVGLNDLFMAWIDKNDPQAPDAYRVLYRLAWERGMRVMYDDILSGKFEEELK